MPRYRSVKPEFWTDADMLEASDSCALFYIALWNFCDDEGKIKNQPKAISKQVARWTPDKVQLFIRSLVASGQLRLSLCSAWLQVVNWSHQKINRPIQPKVLASQIQWVTKIDSVNTQLLLTDESLQGEEKKGKEEKGEDGKTPPNEKDFNYEFKPSGDESLKDFETWTAQVLAGDDPLFLNMVRNNNLTLNGKLDNLARDHLGKAARYNWHVKTTTQQAFRLSLISFITENINKQPHASIERNTTPASAIHQPGKGFGDLRPRGTNGGGKN